MLQLLIGGLVEGVKGYFGHKKAKTEAKRAVEIEGIQKDSDWEQTQAKNSGSSWKDEHWTLVLTPPLILVFFPSTAPAVQQGFTVLGELPEYYQYLLFVAIGSSFGVKVWKTPWGR